MLLIGRRETAVSVEGNGIFLRHMYAALRLELPAVPGPDQRDRNDLLIVLDMFQVLERRVELGHIAFGVIVDVAKPVVPVLPRLADEVVFIVLAEQIVGGRMLLRSIYDALDLNSHFKLFQLVSRRGFGLAGDLDDRADRPQAVHRDEIPLCTIPNPAHRGFFVRLKIFVAFILGVELLHERCSVEHDRVRPSAIDQSDSIAVVILDFRAVGIDVRTIVHGLIFMFSLIVHALHTNIFLTRGDRRSGGTSCFPVRFPRLIHDEFGALRLLDGLHLVLVVGHNDHAAVAAEILLRPAEERIAGFSRNRERDIGASQIITAGVIVHRAALGVKLQLVRDDLAVQVVGAVVLLLQLGEADLSCPGEFLRNTISGSPAVIAPRHLLINEGLDRIGILKATAFRIGSRVGQRLRGRQGTDSVMVVPNARTEVSALELHCINIVAIGVNELDVDSDGGVGGADGDSFADRVENNTVQADLVIVHSPFLRFFVPEQRHGLGIIGRGMLAVLIR